MGAFFGKNHEKTLLTPVESLVPGPYPSLEKAFRSRLSDRRSTADGVGRDAVGVDDGATLGVIAITRHGLGCVMGSATADVAHGAAPLERVVAIISHAVGVDDGTALGLIAVASHSAGRGIHSTLGVDDGATLGILLVSSHSGVGVGHVGFVKVSAVTMGGNVRGHREQDG